jgi:cell division topological specificity factor
MGIFSFFRSRNDGTTAKVAKDRLQVLIAHERSSRDGPDFLPMLRQDIMDVIRKYVPIGDDSVSVNVEQQDACDVLELNITLPEQEVKKADPGVPSDDARRRAAERRAAASSS